MNRSEFVSHISGTYQEALDILAKKNQDYGADSDPFKNFNLVAALGVTDVKTGIMVRLCDKFARLSNLVKDNNPAVKDESLEDTLLDAINYLAILRARLAHEKAQEGHKETNDKLAALRERALVKEVKTT